jgi:putative membrane protein
MMWGGTGIGLVWMIAFWIGVVSLAVWALGNRTREPKSRALEILEERFARGEIDVEQFETRRNEMVR